MTIPHPSTNGPTSADALLAAADALLAAAAAADADAAADDMLDACDAAEAAYVKALDALHRGGGDRG